MDSDLDEEDENAIKIRETVALARGLFRVSYLNAHRITTFSGMTRINLSGDLHQCCREGPRLPRHGCHGNAGPHSPGLVHQPRRHCALSTEAGTLCVASQRMMT